MPRSIWNTIQNMPTRVITLCARVGTVRTIPDTASPNELMA